MSTHRRIYGAYPSMIHSANTRVELLLAKFGITTTVWVSYNEIEIRAPSPCPALFPVLSLYFPATLYEKPYVVFVWEGQERKAKVTIKLKGYTQRVTALRTLASEMATPAPTPIAGNEETQELTLVDIEPAKPTETIPPPPTA